MKNDTKNNQAPVSNVKGFDKLDDRLEYVPGSIQYVSGSNKEIKQIMQAMMKQSL